MPGYFMGVINGISDPAGMEAYSKVAMPTIEQYGGKPIFISSGVEAGDGGWSPMAVVLFEFESSEQSRKWYNSSEYQAVIGQRLAAADSQTVFIDV